VDLDLRGELEIDGEWVDATGNILKRQALTHTRGRQDQGARVDPSTLRPLLNNTDGRFSPDNPTGPYYGKFGRNTPFRLSLRAGSPALDLPGVVGAHASTPDDASLDITGDIDVRVDAQLTNWLEPTDSFSTVELIGKSASGGRSWFLAVRSERLYFEWSADGSASLSATSTVVLPLTPSGRMAVRATLDVNNGAGGRTTTFYTAPTMDGPWTQLGDPVTASGTTSIFNSSTAVRVGDATGFVFTPPAGRILSAEIRNGIGGTVVANPDFTAQSVGATSFTDGAGRTWTVNGAASISNRRTRLSHELAAYPTEWHPSGKHAWVDATTAGILRRMRRSSRALESTLRRRIPSDPSLVAYWPMEDGRDASRFYSPIPGVTPIKQAGMDLAADDTLAGSSALPTLKGGCTFSGTVPAPPGAPTSWHTEFVFYFDNSSLSTGRTVLQWRGTGTVARWRLMVTPGGADVYGYDADDAVVTSSLLDLTGLGVFNAWCRWQLFAEQNGGNVDWHLRFVPIGGVGTGLVSDSYAGDVGRISGVTGLPDGASAEVDGFRLGHLGVFTEADTLIYNDADLAFAGETAGERMQRLVGEEAVPLTVTGTVADQTRVGPQRPARLLELLEEAADADGGILYEERERPRLRYRDRRSMYNQTPALELDYTQPGLAPPLRPTGDDDATENDVEVQRINGSTARAVLGEGPLSVLDPPDGVGPYPASYQLNLYSDDQVEPQAYWRMHLGTFEGRRYPQVRVMAHRASADVVDQVLNVDVGDKIVIRNPPVWVAPDDIELIVQGYEESFAGPFQWDIVFTCTPADPWEVFVLGDTVHGRLDTSGSELASPVAASDTELLIATDTGHQPWINSTDHASMFPFAVRLGGEVVEVTAISGSASPQTFTVVRSVNGVEKAHPAGTRVRYARVAVGA
jgi:hypothetical protein